MNFGNDPYGIMSACNTETLHAAKNGYIMHFLRALFDEFLSANRRKVFDKLARWLCLLPRQSAEAQFKRLRFKDGISDLTKTTGDEKHNILKVVLLILCTDEGKKAVQTKPSIKGGGLIGWKDLLEVVELLLSFVAWTSKDKF